MSLAEKPAQKNKERLANVFAALFGTLIALSLLKFPNAVVMEQRIDWPTNIYEAWFASWPVTWAYGALILIAVPGIFVFRWSIPRPKWLVLLPLLWLCWQFVAATQTQNQLLTGLTLRHFTATIAIFYLGLFALPQAKNVKFFWAPVIVSLCLVVWIGVREQFFGRAATRQYIYQHEKAHWKDLPEAEVQKLAADQVILRTLEGYTVNPKFLGKVQSSRISSTLFYPNSLAGALLLLGPVVACLLWQFTWFRLRQSLRVLIMVVFTGAALICLYCSGSKSGWLLAMFLGFICCLRLRVRLLCRCAFALGFLAAGLAGFFWTHSQFFEKGASSVVARKDYWKAALHITKENALVGTGPGTFYVAYQKVKQPKSEITWLVHNDYLQQASDSGIPGFLTYIVFMWGALGLVTVRKVTWQSPYRFAIWLGLLGWSLQSLAEFNLYMPALAWPAFALLGWMLAPAKESTKSGLQPSFAA
jgi:hypothetical protein